MGNIHRENIPPMDLGPIEARIMERRNYTRGLGGTIAVTIDSDTEMLEALVTEVKRVRLANTSLRAALGPLRAMPVAE